MSDKFDAEKHLTNIKGKEYLEVKWRLVWFRSEHPLEEGWGIRTYAEEVTQERSRFRAEVIDPQGRVVATGTKTETVKGFPDHVEKSETGAIGRALAICGYGTQFTGDELDEGERLADSPVERSNGRSQRLDEPRPDSVAVTDEVKELRTWFRKCEYHPDDVKSMMEELSLGGKFTDLSLAGLQQLKAYAEKLAQATSPIDPQEVPV